MCFYSNISLFAGGLERGDQNTLLRDKERTHVYVYWGHSARAPHDDDDD